MFPCRADPMRNGDARDYGCVADGGGLFQACSCQRLRCLFDPIARLLALCGIGFLDKLIRQAA